MEFPYPKYRETERMQCSFPDAVSDWSGWYKLIDPERDMGRDYTNRNGNNEGSYREGENLPGDGVCGIYEWKVKKEDDEIVVYVGSSCNDGRAPLRRRILEYCKNGAHKKDVINDALRKGYEMYVRYMEFSDVGQSMEAENTLLKTFNYVWNVRENAIRKPLKGGLAEG